MAIDINKLNPLVRKMALDLQKAKKSMGLGLACNAINFKMASIAGQMRVMIDTQAGFGTATANFYGLSFSPSGSGKSVGVTLLDNMYFKDAFDYMKNEIYPRYEKIARKKLEAEGIERALQAWTPKANNATLSGLYSASESAYLVKVGNVNISVDEVADAVVSKADLFDILLECYNNGDFPAQLKRSDNNPLDISGIPINLYAFGDKTKLTGGDNIETSFQNLLKTGYGRRFLFSDDKTVEVDDISPKEYVKQMKATNQIVAEREPDRRFIKGLLCKANLNKVLKLSDEAMFYYAEIQCEGERYVRENKGLADAVQSDILNRVFKTVKLAGIYAFFEEEDTVQLRHMQEAFHLVEESSRVLIEITKIKPTHYRLLDKMLEEDKPCTQQHFLSYPFIPSSWTKKIQEIIDLAKELASEKGYVWSEKAIKGVVYYRVTEKTPEDEEEIFEIAEKEQKEKEELMTKEQEMLLKELYD
jgi:hypothetical protein